MSETETGSRLSCFQGEERLETFPLLGRVMRKGSPAELRISDAARVREALRSRNGKLARDYLSILRPNCEGMILAYTEFVLSFPPVLLASSPPLDHLELTRLAFGLWKETLAAEKEYRSQPWVNQLLQIFSPERITPDAVETFRKDLLAGKPTWVSGLLEEASRGFQTVADAIEQSEYENAAQAFDRWYLRMRLTHDALVDFFSLHITAATELHGQAQAERILRQAFTTSMSYEGLWKAIKSMSVEETAAFLAEHLRAHFSGPDREGSVQIIEESDRYRLVFSPCGSGGAMRRRASRTQGAAAEPMPEASCQTWRKAGEVPGYCTHCAINELESVKRLGYPIFVTEFNRDPEKPCGWTLFKDPDQIPPEYFSRLGEEKKSSRFIRLKGRG